MATSACPKCGKNQFEISETSPKGSRFRYMFVQCANCGTVVGVLDGMNVGAMLGEVLEELKKIVKAVGA